MQTAMDSAAEKISIGRCCSSGCRFPKRSIFFNYCYSLVNCYFNLIIVFGLIGADFCQILAPISDVIG